MTLPQTKFRELVFQILFRNQFIDEREQDDLNFYMKALKTTKKNVTEAKEYVQELTPFLPRINKVIDEVCVGYDLDRIQSVEINILRLCVYEMLFEKKAPPQVIISEGIRLAKKFSTKDAVPFVNAILDQVYKNKSDSDYTL